MDLASVPSARSPPQVTFELLRRHIDDAWVVDFGVSDEEYWKAFFDDVPVRQPELPAELFRLTLKGEEVEHERNYRVTTAGPKLMPSHAPVLRVFTVEAYVERVLEILRGARLEIKLQPLTTRMLEKYSSRPVYNAPR